MTIRARKRLLVLINLALALAVAAVAWWAATPVEADWPGRVAPGDADALQPAAPRAPLRAYAAIWQRDLRRPLYDPEPVRVVAQPPPRPPVPVQLTGTVVEPGFTYAFLRTRGEPARMARVGDVVEGATILQITHESMTVDWHGRSEQLRIEGAAP